MTLDLKSLDGIYYPSLILKELTEELEGRNQVHAVARLIGVFTLNDGRKVQVQMKLETEEKRFLFRGISSQEL